MMMIFRHDDDDDDADDDDDGDDDDDDILTSWRLLWEDSQGGDRQTTNFRFHRHTVHRIAQNI